MKVEHRSKFGVLPTDWLIQKVGDLCKVGTGGTPNTKFPEYYEPATVNWIKSGDVKGPYITSAEHKISDAGVKNSAATLHPRGTVLMAMSGRGKTRGTTAILRIEAACSQSVAAITPGRDVTSEFVHFQFVKRYQEIRAITGNDDRSGLNMSLIRSIDLIVPPLDEQQKIGRVLGAVERAIEQQGRLLTLTAELKNALLRQLLDQGLHGEVQKQTDIGSVPLSWEITELGTVVNLFGGYAFKSEEGVKRSNTQLVRMGNLYQNRLDLNRSPIFYPDEFAEIYPRFVLRPGDLVMSLTGTSGKEDFGFIVELKPQQRTLLLNQRVARVDLVSDRLTKEFLHYFLLSRKFLDQLYPTAKGMKQANLSTHAMKRLKIPIPCVDEQNELASCFRTIDSKIDLHQAKLNSLRDLLRTLLHQFMTAQIRVNDLNLHSLEELT